MSVFLNPILSGASASGSLDTTVMPLKVEMGNSDTVGHVSFALENTAGQWSKMLLSGNQTCEIDVVQNGVTTVLWAGTVEKATPQIDTKMGNVTTVDAYGLERELLNVVSPDARQPYLTAKSGDTGWTGAGVNILSGDGGIAAPAGMDLVLYTSGINFLSGATVSQFMAQWFGSSGVHDGSFSGAMLGFKPYVSGYTWKTYYVPDAANGTLASDANLNFYLPIDRVKAKHEYGWDTLRKITRQQQAIDSTGNPVAFEMYTDASGAIHCFTSGSYEILSSGVLQYYAAGASGANLNNIVSAKVPYDLTAMKNYQDDWFPDWQSYPYDRDAWTDLIALSGGAYWSGVAQQAGQGIQGTSGYLPAGNGGFVSMMFTGRSGKGQTSFVWTFTLSSGIGTPVNLNQFNVAQSGQGVGNNVSVNFASYITVSSGDFSSSGSLSLSILDSGATNSIQLKVNLGLTSSGWQSFSLPIFSSGGVFNSGLWSMTGTFDFNRVTQFQFGPAVQLIANPLSGLVNFAIDNLNFSFDYPFSPVVAFNSGSQGMYGRRYAVVEWPYEVSANAASGIANGELNNRMGSQGISEFVVRDNPLVSIGAQLSIKPGYVFVVDAPSLATGSGQPFFYWRASKVAHTWSKNGGFETTINAYPWFSGTVTAPNSNYINYKTPTLYSTVVPQPEHESYAPVNRPWRLPGPRG